jgi:uncharacterized protein YndB with AHSA1/START domain
MDAAGVVGMTGDATARAESPRRRRAVHNNITINRPPDVVFDYLTDLRRELEWNEQLRSVEPLTEEPLHAGSRYRVHFGRGVGVALITYTAVDRPTAWATTSSSAALDVRFHATVVPVADGSLVTLHTELAPKGLLRVAAPVVRAAMHRSWTRHLRDIKQTLESDVLQGASASADGRAG